MFFAFVRDIALVVNIYCIYSPSSSKIRVFALPVSSVMC